LLQYYVRTLHTTATVNHRRLQQPLSEATADSSLNPLHLRYAWLTYGVFLNLFTYFVHL